MAELGKALAQARIARGLTLHDVERDTRISQRYLQALENEEFDALPAPVYARAFLRTYAQYLGLSAPVLLQRLPGAKPEPELPPLPEVGQRSAPTLSVSWVIAAVVIFLFFGAGLLILRGRGGGEETATSEPPAAATVGAGAEAPPGQPSPAPAVQPGQLPDLRGQDLPTALIALHMLQLRYLIIELRNDEAPEGTVFQQSPSPGSAFGPGTTVTLLVSR